MRSDSRPFHLPELHVPGLPSLRRPRMRLRRIAQVPEQPFANRKPTRAGWRPAGWSSIGYRSAAGAACRVAAMITRMDRDIAGSRIC